MKLKDLLNGHVKIAVAKGLALACGMIWASSLALAGPITSSYGESIPPVFANELVKGGVR